MFGRFRLYNVRNWNLYFVSGCILVLGWTCQTSSDSANFQAEEDNFNWSSISPPVRDSALALIEGGQLTGRYIGIGGWPSQQYDRASWIRSNASKSELDSLKQHHNSAVRATAYEALLLRDSSTEARYNLLLRALNDTLTFISYQQGCIGDVLMLGEYLILQTAPNLIGGPPSRMPEVSEGFTETQVATIREQYEYHLAKKRAYYDLRFPIDENGDLIN